MGSSRCSDTRPAHHRNQWQRQDHRCRDSDRCPVSGFHNIRDVASRRASPSTALARARRLRGNRTRYRLCGTLPLEGSRLSALGCRTHPDSRQPRADSSPGTAQQMTQGLASYAEVAVPVAVHGTFTYTIPDPLRDSVRLGSRVAVEIGSKLTTGFVVGFNDSSETTKLKPVRSVLDEDEPPLLPDIIQLCRWAAEYYIAPLGEMLRVALPANMGARGRREAALVASEAMIAAALDARQLLEP